MVESDKQVFESLASKYMDDLYSNAIKLEGGIEKAEILVQQTYATAYNVFDQFDKSLDFNEWLTLILMHTFASLHSLFEESAENR